MRFRSQLRALGSNSFGYTPVPGRAVQASSTVSGRTTRTTTQIQSQYRILVGTLLPLAALLASPFFALPAHGQPAHGQNVPTQVVPRSLSRTAKGAVVTLPTTLANVAGVEPEVMVNTVVVPAGLRGWDHLFRLMVTNGVDSEKAAALLRDKRLPPRDSLFFSLNPRESKHLYRKHNTPRTRKNALEFYRTHRSSFEKAERTYGVPQSVILAILQVETHCGRFTGRTPIFHRLARLATAADPENILENFLTKKKSDAKVTRSAVEARALWLQETFFPHVLATIELAESLNTHPLELLGSGGGAMGLPQFLPGNIEKFGADGNGDKVVDLYEPADAIHSVARFLREHGWDSKKKKMTTKEKREVIFAYNRSSSYVDTVLSMAGALAPQLNPPRKSTKRR